MSTSACLHEFHSASVGSSSDALFLERLESFMEKSLSDIKAFAERESQSYEEARRYVAEWHAKNLFLPSSSSSSSPSCSESVQSLNSHTRLSMIPSALREASAILESLSTISGVQSFLLAIDPYNPSDGGFLGGSVVGREFWRGLRSGGETGARSFKTHCTAFLRSRVSDTDVSSPQPYTPSQLSVPPAPKIYHAKSLKNQLYESVRSALRSASGVRTAEMKWTNPERLDVYGVRLVGWPEGVPAQNPSSLKSSQNRSLLDALQNGTMRFEKLVPVLSTVDSGQIKDVGGANEDFSWAYDADACPSSPIEDRPASAAKSAIIPDCPTVLTVANEVPSVSYEGENPQETWHLEDHIIGDDSQYSTDYTWADELHEEIHSSVDIWVGDGEQLESERPRKRMRSEEPPIE